MIGVISSVLSTGVAVYLLTPWGRSRNVEKPVYTTVAEGIRDYGPMTLASTPIIGGDIDGAFRVLAAYIGVTGTPQNMANERIAMTAPVLMRLDAQGRDPVEMYFVLPAEIGTAPPGPSNPAVRVSVTAPQRYRVLSLGPCMEFDKPVKLFAQYPGALIARYDDPLVLKPLRTNELWVALSE